MSGVDYIFVAEGLSDLSGLNTLAPAIQKAAYRAINATANRARKASADEMRKQVNFPARYLSGAGNRLTVTDYANATKLSAEITGRRRPTSLARFATAGARVGKKGPVGVEVKPGVLQTMGRSFLMRLRSGSSGELNNVGLAVRTAKGKRPDAAYKPLKIAEGLWLLYGPSVDQVFKSVREDVSPDAIRFMEAEFNRLMGAYL